MIEIREHGSNPGNLNMFIHIPPAQKDRLVKKPLVVVLHGCTQNASSISSISGWNKLADKYGFIVLYPQQKFINNPTNCFNWFKKKEILKDKGEVLSIKQMIEITFQTYAIDTSKVFVYGLSAGAAMGVALMADYPALFNAGAILAGVPYIPVAATNRFSSITNPEKYSGKELANFIITQNKDYTKKYPRLIIVHGKKDNVVNINQSYSLLKQWANLNKIDTVPDLKMIAFDNKKDITKIIYKDASNNSCIIFYEIDNLGHALMIDPGDGIKQGGEMGNFAVDKDFFSTYWIAVDFGLIKE